MDATQELQEEIIVALRANPAVAALVANRVYDNVASAQAPYVSMGPADAVQADADCIDGQQITVQIDCWSDQRGFQEARRVADAVKRALHRRELPFQHNALVTLEHRITRTMRDADGISSHAVVTFTAFVETP